MLDFIRGIIMRKGGSKAKGNSFENKIYDDVRAKGYFIRKNKGSGNAEDNKGDLETNNLLIECKHHKKVTEGMVIKWMDKILLEAKPLDKYPILIVKENYTPIKVYYLKSDNTSKEYTMYYMDYNTWLNENLKLEHSRIKVWNTVEKKDIPSYIG